MPQSPVSTRFRLSIDSWAVIAALAAVLLIRFGVFKSIAW